MYLSKLTIKNFRKIKELTINFQSGLNVIVGPNNIGKTAVIDALRALLCKQDDNFPRFSPDDIRVGSDESEFSFHYLFTDLTEADEADFFQALVPNEAEKFDASFTINYHLSDNGEYLRTKKWCGQFEENPITSEMFDNLYAVYLEPLRDVIQSLKPGRLSKQARLLRHIATDKDKENLNNLLKEQDKALQSNSAILTIQDIVYKQHIEMLGTTLSQVLALGINSNDFNKLLSRLALTAETFDIDRNGLGYGNLVYMAVVLSELSGRRDTLYQSMLIEEPEAHLHPQLQYVLLQYLKSFNSNEDHINQIFLSSHSPNLVSKADLDSLICMFESNGEIHAKALREVSIAKKEKQKLERYLDVTRSELFFAKKILFVEGIAEQLLIKEFARKLGHSIDKENITVVNVEGLNFDAFLPLFNDDALTIRVAVLTDSDPGKDEFPQIDDPINDQKLKKFTDGNDWIKGFFSKKTFEYDLALEEKNLPVLLKACEEIHPKIAEELNNELHNSSPERKPEIFFKALFQERETRKGVFAQVLAGLIPNNDVAVPNYIEDAIKYLISK